MCSSVLVLLLTRKLYTMRCVFLRQEGRKRVAGGWQWVTGGRKRADSWARCMSSSCRPCYWCSDSLRCWVKLLQSKHCRAQSREDVYLAPQSPETENNTSMHTFSCCIWEVILVLSAVIQPFFLGIIKSICVAWKPSQTVCWELLCWFPEKHGRLKSLVRHSG